MSSTLRKKTSLSFLQVTEIASFGSLLLLVLRSVPLAAAENASYSYSDDASWAIVSTHLSSELGDKQQIYDEFMVSCKEAVISQADTVCDCDDEEEFRMEKNRAQPASVYNYTKEGYKKIKSPPELYRIIKDFFDTNKDEAKEEWENLNTYHNLWDSPRTLVSLTDERQGIGLKLKNEVLEHSRKVLEEWTGQLLIPKSLYGVRIYSRGSILAPHVDRMPLIVSAIINVDQDVDEPWPLEVYGHDGKAVNVTMEPGDMILYESHSIIHGRPFPLEGSFYANVFIHFEPLAAEIDHDDDDKPLDIPPYLIPGSEWETYWRMDNPGGYRNILSNPHAAAQYDDIRVLQRLIKSSPTMLHQYDARGWLPLHDAVRAGHIKAVQLMLLNGGDVNRPTAHGTYPLHIAYEELGEEHEMTQLLRSHGAAFGEANKKDKL